MISLKSFIKSIHDAVISASDTVSDRNKSMIDTYFEHSKSEGTSKEIMSPRMIVLEYPTLGPEGKEIVQEVNVPLITLIPLQIGQVEQATITAEFDIFETDGELELGFSSKTGSDQNSNGKHAKLEVIVKPHEMPEGIQIIVDGYERVLRRQTL